MHRDPNLPAWRSHKRVWASKIVAIRHGTDGDDTLLMVDAPGVQPIRVRPEWMRKHEPHVGGYFVEYEDGYRSFSPAAPFEGGHTRIWE